MLLKVDDSQRAATIICSNCNTRQIVPNDAMPAFESPPRSPPPVASADPAPPSFILLAIGAWVLTTLGLIACAICAILAFSDVERGSLAIMINAAACFVVASLGQLMLAVRDIAQSSWHLRPKK
jgi:hypothetical protein